MSLILPFFINKASGKMTKGKFEGKFTHRSSSVRDNIGSSGEKCMRFSQKQLRCHPSRKLDSFSILFLVPYVRYSPNPLFNSVEMRDY